jgi:hypothetical protein
VDAAKVICERCRRPQANRTAQVSDPANFYLGCVSCGFPYAVYAKGDKNR